LHDFGVPDLIIVPGGGSGFHDSAMTPAHFARWGETIAAQGYRVVFVAGPAYSMPAPPDPRFRLLRGVAGGALRVLLARSRLVLVNGGDTLLQAMTLGKACVAVPIAGDQPERIARCAATGAVIAPLLRVGAADAVVSACLRLLGDTGELAALEARVQAAGLQDAMPAIIQTLGDCLHRS
jgi:UDP:flavonoid glycosyltransferase YjiC (YdhE family)